MNLFGSITYKVRNEYSQKIFRFISSNSISAEKMQSKSGYLYITVSYELKKDFERMLSESCAEYSIVSRKGLIPLVLRVFEKKGLIIGSAVSAIVWITISNLIFSF